MSLSATSLTIGEQSAVDAVEEAVHKRTHQVTEHLVLRGVRSDHIVEWTETLASQGS